jgi:hypothetical protein
MIRDPMAPDLLHPVYPDGSAMELAQFAAACLGEVERLTEHRNKTIQSMIRER